MNIVIGLTEDDIDALSGIREVLNGCIDEYAFPDKMTEEQYHDWLNMGNVINKICYVIENQTEIDKTATGITPAAACKECCVILHEVCQEKKQETGDKSVCLKKMIEFLDGHEIPESILIDTGQNYKKCQ